jgi:oligosaccharide repeat unit polymerase
MTSPHFSRPAGNRRRLLLLIQAVLVSVVAAVGIGFAEFPANLDNAVFPVCVLVSGISVWNFCSWRLLGQEWFGPYGLFLISATLFNGGQAFLEILDLNLNGVLDGRYAPELTVKALYMVALGLAALHLGAIGASRKPAVPGRLRPRFSDDGRDNACRAVGWSCIWISAIPSVLVLRDMVVTAASRGYSGLYGRPDEEILSSAIRFPAGFLVTGIMFLAAGSRKQRHSLALAAVLMAVYSGIVMYSGERRLGAPVLLAFAWLYHSRIRRLSRTTLAIALSAGIGLLGLLTIVAEVRNAQGSWLESVQKARATSRAAQNPFVGAVSEMGGTGAGRVADTINLIPAVRPFDYGAGYGYGFVSLLPNLGWAVHPATVHGSYSEWLTRTLDPRIDAHGGGFGYSFIAEPFANFGWYGVAPLLFLTGYLFVRMCDWATLTDDPAKYAFVAAALVPLLFFPRDETERLFRPLLYYCFLPYAAARLWTKRAPSKSREARSQRIALTSIQPATPTRGSLAKSRT